MAYLLCYVVVKTFYISSFSEIPVDLTFCWVISNIRDNARYRRRHQAARWCHAFHWYQTPTFSFFRQGKKNYDKCNPTHGIDASWIHARQGGKLCVGHMAWAPKGLEGWGKEQGWAGWDEGENPRGGSKKGVNRLIQKFNKSAQIVIEIFVVHYDVLIKENIISFHFKKVFLWTR